ncbi:Hsp20/alpha crystallin family protein [Desulfohalovibrio reitneri]|uniref:Hsp20/alpha crystallin family protein n=1 Tax=Desulfohalovibrio reitneri TaxID=1307759 RepID=UPI0004A7621A|nr:Hsp20/alpha crystallin family protein [Desulfohalovibrio reitneri]
MEMNRLKPWNWFRKEEQEAMPARSEFGVSREMRPWDVFRDMDRFFERAMREGGMPEFPGELQSFKPRVDIAGKDGEYVVTAELPGVDEKDISLDLSGDNLVLTAKKDQEKKEEDKEGGYYRVERSYGSFRRVFTLPADVDRENIKANYDKGVLTITMPRSEQLEQGAKRIEIGGS